MKNIKVKLVWDLEKWEENVLFTVGTDGLIKDKTANATNDNCETLDAILLPGFQNAHSHAFQYAMAGLAEIHPASDAPDDFWGWRESMYQLALTLDPDDLESIATMLYSEMARMGYTHVAEFHYLHHDKNGKFYNERAEMGGRLIAAAEKAGIRITLVPMFYQQGGFGMAPQPRQRRFINTQLDDYAALIESSKKLVAQSPIASLGHGIHSLRAIKPDTVANYFSEYNFEGPFHIHISEQLKEITDAQAFLGARPVEWLVDNAPVSDNFHLVHATHLTASEIQSIVSSGSNVVICPTTEGNLGDGIFPLKAYQNLGGNWSIGTDSHVGIHPMEELRLLDYGQRLTSHRRNTYIVEGQVNSGEMAFNMAWKTGRKGMGCSDQNPFKIGNPLDGVLLHANWPLLSTCSHQNLLNTIIYTSDTSALLGTMINGKLNKSNAIEDNKIQIANDFKAVLKRLKTR